MSKKKNKTDVPAFLMSEIFKAFHKNPNRTFNYRQLFKLIKPSMITHMNEIVGSDVHVEDLVTGLKKSVQEILPQLVKKGDLIEVDIGKYKLKPQHAYLEGNIDFTNSGAAYLLSENQEDDVYIAPKNVKNALHGDRVKIYLYARHKNQRLEGCVVEVLERARTEFAGLIQISNKFAFVVPDSPKMSVDIFIPRHLVEGASHGQKVIAEIVDWPKDAKNPIGKITKLLGWPGENDVEMNSILSEFGFPTEFPRRVEEEAERIPDKIPDEEFRSRKDFRNVTTFTIDPQDAKDFDDAISIRPLKAGRWEIGVHIADVSHYVRPATALDKEAYFRGTSVYLVDRVIPMLPEKLSNGVCSLRPKEDKLCFSAVFEIDEEAKVHHRWMGRTVIHSDKRFSYEDAQEIIESGSGDFSKEILLLDKLAKKLRQDRFRNGAVGFEKTEVRFKLDDSGKPLGVYLKESKDAHKLIEEFMLLANRTVAEFVGKKTALKSGSHSNRELIAHSRPFVYRIHDGPVQERVMNFAKFAGRWGYKIATDTDREIAHSLNGLLKKLHGKKEQNVLEQLAIRTMSKALYTTDNIGHYGLAFDYYTHFTSPIRRYPDVLVHRLLDVYLKNENGADKELLEEQCRHSSQMEVKASEAERASIKYKQVEFLQERLGEIYEGLISGVTEWGLYVEIVENKCEGMIRLRELDDDFYEFDDTNYCVIGARTGRVYTLGDNVEVQVVRCDLLRKQIDLKMIRKIGDVLPEKSSRKSIEKKHTSRKTNSKKNSVRPKRKK
ncbi:MAG: ribonuclease R [Bacteroidetes bacterium]|nr:MAG: ribonuclease R [Bacteroidota bacterium]REK00770.1 MAG: ribonuclease R [Bacteroidota bacterium]REK35018.1 MAG: ribonuclease R [Bacteroidota bacterium]REK48184.1 MAG: ribonuclease R [Bacteroidota bacterium]